MKRERSNISRIYAPPRMRVTDYCLEDCILQTSKLQYNVKVDELDNMNDEEGYEEYYFEF